MEAVKTLLILIGIVLVLYGVGGVALNQILFTDECQLAEQLSKNADFDERDLQRNDEPAKAGELKAKALESKKDAETANQVCLDSNSRFSRDSLMKTVIGLLGLFLISAGFFINKSEN